MFMPKSKAYWKRNKTIHGLACLEHHWYTKISDHLINDMSFESIPQNNYVYKYTLVNIHRSVC